MRFTKRRPDQSASRSRRFRAALETLETRVLLSDVTYSGSSDDDAYTVRLKAGDPSQVEVLESLGGGATTTYTTPLAQIDSLSINTAAGFDTLTIDQSNGPVAIPSGISYDGGADSDELIWNASAAQDSIDIDSASIDSSIVTGSAAVHFSSAEDITVNGNDGADTFAVNATASGTAWTLNGQNGNDLLVTTSQNLDDIAGHIAFNGGADADTVHLDDSANPFSDDYNINATSVSRDVFAGVNYTAAEGLTLDCESGGNNIILSSTAANTPVTVNGGGGGDFLIVGGAPSSAILFNGGLNPAEQDSLAINAGTYTFDADALDGTAHLNVSVSGNGTSVLFNATQHLQSLHLTAGSATLAASGARVLVTNSLAIDTGGKLDLRDNNLIVQSGDLGTWNGSAYTGILGMIQAGRNAAPNSIVTSMPSATPPQILTTLAAAAASQALHIAPAQSALWAGQSVTGNSVLVKYTYAGDADLSGQLNADDYFALDSHYNKSGSAFGYINGDFNYDGQLNGDDYFLIDSNYPVAQSPLAAPLFPATSALPPTPAFPAVWSHPAQDLFAADATPSAYVRLIQADVS